MPALDGQLVLRALRAASGRTVLREQAFRAPFHLSKPYWDATAATLLVQVVNPTAGVLAGDTLTAEIAVDPGAAVLLTTPSATRIFAMHGGSASSAQRLVIGGGGWLEVWPEPLVPHRGCGFRQQTRLTVHPAGAVLYADLLNAGRAAHGEAWAWDRLRLDLEVEVDGELALSERFQGSGPQFGALARFAGAGDAVGVGNAVFVPPATAAVPPDRWRDGLHALQRPGIWIGASPLRVARAWSIKFVAADGILLRQVWQEIRRVLQPVAPHLRCDPRKM